MKFDSAVAGGKLPSVPGNIAASKTVLKDLGVHDTARQERWKFTPGDQQGGHKRYPGGSRGHRPGLPERNHRTALQPP